MSTSLRSRIHREVIRGEQIRKCEARPEGHAEIPAANERLGDVWYPAMSCLNCGAVRVMGTPLPLPSGVPCIHNGCGDLPEPLCDDECHMAIVCDGCNVRGAYEHKCHGEFMQVGGEPTGRRCPCECTDDPPVGWVPA